MFRKKPIVVEAVEFTGDRLAGVVQRDDLPKTDWRDEGMVYAGGWTVLPPFIHTKEGPLHVSVGDWIITGIQGERYPCKPDIFEATYEPA